MNYVIRQETKADVWRSELLSKVRLPYLAALLFANSEGDIPYCFRKQVEK